MTEQRTIADALQSATASLDSTSDTARLDAEVLLAHVLDKPRSFLFAWPEKRLSENECDSFDKLIRVRGLGHPVAYLTGTREFWSLSLKVTPDTLIPRPETELLVETAIEHIRSHDVARVLDLGTGSGAIALAIASECKGIDMCASDSSERALAVALANAREHAIDNVHFVCSHWFENIPGEMFDLIVSNPPYVAEGDPHLHSGDVAFEPLTALASGVDGLDDIRAIASNAAGHLRPGGRLAVEHGNQQAAAVRDILNNSGFTQVKTIQDLQGLDRVSSGMLPAAFG